MLFRTSVTQLLKNAVALCDAAIKTAQAQREKYTAQASELEAKQRKVAAQIQTAETELKAAEGLRHKIQIFTDEITGGRE